MLSIEEENKEESKEEVIIPEESKSLLKIKGIGPKTAQKLIEANIKDAEELGCQRYDEVAEILKIPKKSAKEMIIDAMNNYLSTSPPLGNFGTALQHQRDIVKRIPTGSSVFDGIMKGGIPTEAITIFKGEYETGKSEFCYQLAINCLKYLKRKVVWVETETHTFVADRALEIAKASGYTIKDDDFIYVDASKTATCYTMYMEYQKIGRDVKEKNLDIGLWVIDSFTPPFSIFTERESLPIRAKQERKHLGFLGNFANKYNTAIVLTCQVMDIPDPGAQLGEMVKSGHRKKMAGGGPVQFGGTYLISLEQKAIGQYEGIVFGAPDIPRKPFRFKIATAGVRDI